MGPDDDDFDEREPLPDPTMRTWRHPSELAAVAAMAARDEPGPPRRRLAFGSLLLGGALGAVLVLTVVASTGLVGGDPAGTRFGLRDAASTTSGTAADGSGDPDSTGGPTNPGEATTTAEPSTSTSTSVSTTAPPTSTSELAAPSTAATTVPVGAPLPTLQGIEGELAAAGLPTVPPEAVVGVAVDQRELDRPRCTGLVIDGMVVTSASAIGTATDVTLVVAGAAYPATVLARDRFTDIAVIDPHVDTPLVELPPAAPPGADAAVALVATDGRPEPITVVGRIAGWDHASDAPDGHDLIGLISTTARLPEPGAGSLLLDAQGALVGMVVDTPSHLALAVPEATLRAVVRSLRDTGHAVPVWLGVAVAEGPDGVVLKRVVHGGPAWTAGMRAGDQVVALDGVAVTDLGSFFAAIRARTIGQPLAVTVQRGSETLALGAVLAPHPGPEPAGGDERAAD